MSPRRGAGHAGPSIWLGRWRYATRSAGQKEAVHAHIHINIIRGENIEFVNGQQAMVVRGCLSADCPTRYSNIGTGPRARTLAALP